MSSCLSGGGGGGRAAAAAAYRLEPLDFETIKSPSSTTSWISNTLSSESSTLAISTRKPRTPRKRPNQVYNEAAALLSTAYPKLFPAKHGTTNNFTKSSFLFEPSDLLIPFRAIDASGGFLPRRPNWGGAIWPGTKAPQSPPEHGELDFDAESIILDEEITGQGIDCVMGDFSTNYNSSSNGGDENCDYSVESMSDFCYGYPVGLGFETGEIGMRKEARAMRDGDEGGDWWRFPTVSALDSNQRAAAKRKKKKKKVSEIRDSDLGANRSNDLLLKLNCDAVLEAWSDKVSPFAGECEVAGSDVQRRSAQIDLFSDNNGRGGGLREASMLRYREKRRNRLFLKKIIYLVCKVNVDRWPRMKGRFVRTRDTSYD